jgi:hypothetical protein
VSKDSFPQFDMAYHEGKGYTPVSELMRAIILRAVEDLNCPGELRDDALAFFYAEEDEDDEYVFSFISICRYLGFNPQATRDAIVHAEHRISTRRRAA